MMSTQDLRYSFIVDWYDAQASLVRQYQLLYYPKDSSVEMYDSRYNKKFFRRSKCEGVGLNQLFIGNKINICGRQLDIIDFGDDFTQNQLAAGQERTLGLIKPDAVASAGEIISQMETTTKLRISDAKMVQLTQAQAEYFYQEHQGKDFFPGLVDFMSSGPVLAMSVVGPNAVQSWRQLIGPTNPIAAKSDAPESVRAKYGSVNPKNAAHGSDSSQSADRELDFFFRTKNLNSTSCMKGTCVVVKPHCVLDGQFGKVLEQIQSSGWTVTALQLHNFDRANAEEFYEVYKEVVPEYEKMVSELCTGPCVALEVQPSGNGDQCVAQFKTDIAGPRDPVIAKELDPSSIRALFGEDKVKNAIHCTDLPRDTTLELSYMFQVLCE